jgi:beta-galactosidase GanA
MPFRIPLLLAAIAFLFSGSPAAAADAAPLPRIVTSATGRHTLLVDGAPFLMLGAQANNSSNYPAMLPKIWPVLEQLSANTLEIPVAWEQVEPVEGRYDFSYLDTLLRDARKHNVRLVLLWFGTWKNTGPSYTPEWVKGDTRRFPRMRTAEGKTHYVLSPHGRNTLDADKRAFVRLMEHLRTADPQNIVIMVQVENEIGSYGLGRDHGPEAERLFRGPVPSELVDALGKRPGTWSQLFGDFADQAFASWHMARYADEIAAAGKAVKNLPMYCNSAMGDPFDARSASTSPSGGPQWNMIDVWKAAAPHIDLVAPDIYNREQREVDQILGYYDRPDNALMVPETGNAIDHARFFWSTLGRGTIGYAPFGMDLTGYANYPLGAKALGPAEIEAFASKYRLFAPIARQWAKIAAERQTWGVAKGKDAADQSTVIGRWRVTAMFEMWEFGEREWTWIKSDPHPTKGQPVGGAVVAHLGPDEFLVAGSDVRIRFTLDKPALGDLATMLRVEEGTFASDGAWVMSRVWNGDQTDYGLNFTGQPVLLRVKLGTYR